MDIFTHILLSYLLNIGLENPYWIIGIGIGIAPDMDIFWSPMGKKYFWTKHRGITHSILFVIIFSVIICLILTLLWNIKFWILLPYAILTGLLHVCVDLITTSGIPILYPISKREFKFEIDKAINPYIMGFSFFTIIFLYFLGTIQFDYSLYKLIVTAITISFGIYFCYKLIQKQVLIRRFSSDKEHFNVLPTSGLFVWYLVSKIKKNGHYLIKYGKLNLLEGNSPDLKIFKFKQMPRIKPPVNDIEKVISYTFNLKEVQNYIKKFKYPLAEVSKKIDTENKWVVIWYPLELIMLNRTSALRLDLDDEGNYKARRTFMNKLK